MPICDWSVCSGVGSSSSSHWELMGDSMVTTEQVRLTTDMQSRQGAVWSRIVSTPPCLYTTVSVHHRVCTSSCQLAHASWFESLISRCMIGSDHFFNHNFNFIIMLWHLLGSLPNFTYFIYIRVIFLHMHTFYPDKNIAAPAIWIIFRRFSPTVHPRWTYFYYWT